MDRKPVVAGSFYPSDPEELRDYIRELFLSRTGAGELPDTGEFRKNVGLVVPHAAYVYSGTTATCSYKKASEFGIPDLVAVIGPNHTGYGKSLSVWPRGNWMTPLGNVPVDEGTASALSDIFPAVKLDYDAHSFEHSIEVQLPFLQFVLGTGFKILPVCMMDQRIETAVRLASALKKTLNGRRFWIVASTDLNHYEDHESTLFKDRLVMEAVASNDVGALYERIETDNITMCGFGPVATLLSMGIGTPAVLSHVTSGEISGDTEREVGYLSACVF